MIWPNQDSLHLRKLLWFENSNGLTVSELIEDYSRLLCKADMRMYALNNGWNNVLAN